MERAVDGYPSNPGSSLTIRLRLRATVIWRRTFASYFGPSKKSEAEYGVPLSAHCLGLRLWIHRIHTPQSTGAPMEPQAKLGAQADGPLADHLITVGLVLLACSTAQAAAGPTMWVP